MGTKEKNECGNEATDPNAPPPSDILDDLKSVVDKCGGCDMGERSNTGMLIRSYYTISALRTRLAALEKVVEAATTLTTCTFIEQWMWDDLRAALAGKVKS